MHINYIVFVHVQSVPKMTYLLLLSSFFVIQSLKELCGRKLVRLCILQVYFSTGPCCDASLTGLPCALIWKPSMDCLHLRTPICRSSPTMRYLVGLIVILSWDVVMFCFGMGCRSIKNFMSSPSKTQQYRVLENSISSHFHCPYSLSCVT